MAKLTDMMGRPHSGLVPHAVIGIVVDNVDPDELGRVQVKFPTLYEEPVSFWLRVASPMAGPDRGIYALPEVDDEVLVLFIQGSQDVGVIIGQFWNGVDLPPTECKDGMPGASASDTGGQLSTDTFEDGSTNLDKNDRRFWRSRSGHLFVFDDSDGAETVQIWDNSHKLALVFDTANSRIVLSNTSGDIHIRTKTDLYLEAGGSILGYAGQNIELESGMNTDVIVGQNYTMEAGMDVAESAGMNFNIEASMNLEAKASMNATVEGSLNATFKGGLAATLEGGASCTVKGAIVMIN